MRELLKNCIIKNVEWKQGFDRLAFDITDGTGTVRNRILVCNTDEEQQIQQLLGGKRTVAFLAYGMTDIDISKKNVDTYHIDWSPCDGCNVIYEVTGDELKKIATPEKGPRQYWDD